MSAVSNLYQVEKNATDIRNTVLTNIVKMLTERGYLNKDQLATNIDTIIGSEPGDNVYKVKTDKYDGDNEKLFAVRILQQKITAVNKASGILDFLTAYKNNKMIIVVKSMGKKAYQYIANNFPNAEIFLEEDLMINLIDHVLVPKHELLTPEEEEVFYEKFNCKKRNLPRIFSTDPVARYYNMKPGHICRIIRPSETSGYVVTYRLVVKSAA